MPVFEVLLSFADCLLALVELLEVADLHLNVGLVNGEDFLVQVLNLCLEILDFLVHPLDILLPLPEVLPPLVLLLLQMLLEEAEVAAPLVVDLLAAALPAD